MATIDRWHVSARERATGMLLGMLAVLTFGTGLYFLGVRPALLPEDTRFTGVSADTLPPAFLAWLQLVFRTWGGFITGFALVLGGLAATLVLGRTAPARAGLVAGVLVSFGRFLYSNLVLHSDFVWYIALLFAFAVASAIAVLPRRPSAR